MCVLMLDFVFGGFANVLHGERETQRHAGQRVIAVEHDLVFGDVGDRVDQRIDFLVAVFRRAFELHAHFERLGKTVARLDLHEFGIVVAERVLRLELNLRLVARLMAVELFLDLGERAIIAAVQIDHRLVAFLDQIALCIGQLVSDRHDGVLRFSSNSPKYKSHYTMRNRSQAEPRDAAATPFGAPPSDLPTPLLGGLTPAQFMRGHWQKKPLLIRQAIPGVASPVSRDALFSSQRTMTWNRD